MKTIRFFGIVLLLVGISTSGFSAGAQPKIATIDMSRVFASYHKTKEIEVRLNESREQARKELEERESYLNEAESNVEALIAELDLKDLGEKEREIKAKRLEAKIQDVESLKASIEAFTQSREQQIGERSNRLRYEVMMEIRPVVEEKVKAYDLVFDSSGHGIDEIKFVIFSVDAIDLTKEVIAELVKMAPKQKP
ncbi:MAG: OmpH family outer membrane protein [Verrucomicrobiota bacterium]